MAHASKGGVGCTLELARGTKTQKNIIQNPKFEIIFKVEEKPAEDPSNQERGGEGDFKTSS